MGRDSTGKDPNSAQNVTLDRRPVAGRRVYGGAQGPYPALDREPACQTLTPAAAGGPLPRNPDVTVLRYPGVSFVDGGRESEVTAVALPNARAPSRVETIRRAATTLSTERGEDGEQADNRHRNRHPRGTQLLRFREDDGDKVKRAD